MSQAVPSQGFKLFIGDNDSPMEFVEVKEIKDFQGFDGEASEIDVTHLQSTAKEKRLGLQDYGNFAVNMNYLPTDAGQNLVRAAKVSGSTQLAPNSFKIQYADGRTTLFSGYVKNAPRSGSVDAVISSSFSIMVTGDITDVAAP